MSAATASVSARGWILADFDDTLAPDDSHAGLLRFILRRRIWPLLLWPLTLPYRLLTALRRALYRTAQQKKQGLSRLFPLCAGIFAGLCGVLHPAAHRRAAARP